jgi:hypothetical protein
MCAGAASVGVVTLVQTALEAKTSPTHLGMLFWPEFGAAVASAILLQRPDLERWENGEEPASDSPPLAARLRASLPSKQPRGGHAAADRPHGEHQQRLDSRGVPEERGV